MAYFFPGLEPDFLIVLEYFVIIILGLVFGSFATAMIYRIPRGLAWAFARKSKDVEDISAYRSACPHCKTELRVLDLIPVFSWLIARGRCNHCGHAVHIKYLLTELGLVLAALGVYWSLGFSWEGALILLCLPFLAALFVIDLEYMILPNQLVLILGIFALINLQAQNTFNYVPGDEIFFNYILGGAVLYGFLAWLTGWMMARILKKEALGFGDVKFFMVAGLWLGLAKIGWFCIISGIAGIIFALIWRLVKKDPVFPFGPSLIAAFYVLLLLDGSFFL